ncbi:exported hypothetical protein [Agrobacterium tumefaciens str. CFBP 5621]|nr:exported hypothetical protein [Agrobacterium tumefaciens str. CFBP 5621]
MSARAPGYWLFAAALVVIGVAALSFTTNSLQIWTTRPSRRLHSCVAQ